MSYVKSLGRATGVLAVAILLAGPAAANVNKSIKIDDGAEAGSQSTVNGSITVGNGATLTGDVQTVNGAIRLGDSVQANDVSTVNGSIRAGDGLVASAVESVNGTIRLGGGSQVAGDVSVVNGKIQISAASTIGQDVSNVNGELILEGAQIGGDVSTVSGDVTLTGGSTVQGDLIIEKPGGWSWGRRKEPRIVIGPNSQVLGTIDARREIALYISDTASVGGVTGEASMDDAVRFSGERP